jgi:membrane protein YdbS with pleckstrin-like domain
MTAGDGGTGKTVYRGIWAVLAGLFKVPNAPPTLIALGTESIESFRPSVRFLDYLKFLFWIGLLVIDAALFLAWIVLVVANPVAGIVLAPLFFLVMVVPDIFAYVALHLRYDTTWYVMSDRSMRIRRGIWVIRETTITFENVQNVELKQGPLQRHFGIANLIVQTAGGSGARTKQGQPNPHEGLIEGLDDAKRIRDVIMSRVRRSRRTGLGDEHPEELRASGPGAVWSPAHLEALRAIRDQVALLRSRAR